MTTQRLEYMTMPLVARQLWPVEVEVMSSSVTCESISSPWKDNTEKISPTSDPERKMDHYLLEERLFGVSQVLCDPTTPHFRWSL